MRFSVLDGLRGVAAVGVLLFHLGETIGVGMAIHAYLSVDLFFLLSGFVIAHRYDAALRSRQRRSFLRRRLVRLYPLIALGALLGIGASLAAVLADGRGHLTPAVIATGALAVFLIPYPFGMGTPSFPVNPPLWSLFWEVVANVAYAVLAPLLSDRALTAIVLVSAAALAVVAATIGTTDLGWGGADFVWGGLRAAFSFPLGMLMLRLHRRGRLDFLGRAPTPIPLAVLALVIAAPPLPAYGLAFELSAIFVVLPAAAACAMAARPNAVLARRLEGLGAVSYPLYATHAPMLCAGSALAAVTGLPRVALAAIAFSTAVIVAIAVGRWIEPVLRKRLEQCLPPGRGGGAPAVSSALVTPGNP